MSFGFAVRSLGQAYAALSQENLAGMDPFAAPRSGGSQVQSWMTQAIVRLDQLPEQRSFADETHALFSYRHRIELWYDLIILGISPNGRLIGQGPLSTLSSNPGTISADGEFHDVVFESRESGTQTLKLDGVLVASSGGPAPGDIGPTDGPGQFVLFNDSTSLSRLKATVSEFSVFGVTWAGGPISGRIDWDPLNDPSKPFDDWTDYITTKHPADMALSPIWQPAYGFVLPWGPLPTTSPAGAFVIERTSADSEPLPGTTDLPGERWRQRELRAPTWADR